MTVKDFIDFLNLFEKDKIFRMKSASGAEWNVITKKVNLEKIKNEKEVVIYIE